MLRENPPHWYVGVQNLHISLAYLSMSLRRIPHFKLWHICTHLALAGVRFAEVKPLDRVETLLVYPGPPINHALSMANNASRCSPFLSFQ